MTAVTYRICVRGHLDPLWAEWFGGMALVREPDWTTTITGAVVDQAALHGLLVVIRDLGLELVSVEQVGPGGGTGTLPGTAS
ncbi:MAG: hypothetical protein AB8I80_12625 [Anaerolineae bacterium]